MDTVKGYFGLINERYSELLAKEIIIAYDGDVTHQVMKAFTSLVEEKLESENENETLRRRLYHILVECLQNINRHAEAFFPEKDFDAYPGRGALLVSKASEYYRVITANIIQNSEVPEMRKFLDRINQMSDDELNDLYKQQLKEGQLSSKGGAGLGFIDVRRKADSDMEYHFIDNDEQTSYFLFNVLIRR
jgi:uncharacterized membrane protein YvbJ